MTDNSLKIVLHSVFMSCGVEEVTADIHAIADGAVEIQLGWKGGEDLHCLCPVDITQVVGNLKEGGTYHFSVYLSYQERASFDVRNFSAGLTGTAAFY